MNHKHKPWSEVSKSVDRSSEGYQRELARLTVENDAPRYHPQVRRPGGTWGPPNVGGIADGFVAEKGARDLIAVLIKHDGTYYARCEWRVVEVTTRVLPPGESITMSSYEPGKPRPIPPAKCPECGGDLSDGVCPNDAYQRRAIPPGSPLPLHRTEAGYPSCSTCDGGGCPDCTDPA